MGEWREKLAPRNGSQLSKLVTFSPITVGSLVTNVAGRYGTMRQKMAHA